MKPTLTTDESSGSTLRLPIVCSASTICAPITKGSMPRCGCAAWVPRLDANIPAVGGGEQRARFRGDRVDRNAGLIVEGEDSVARRLVEQPFFDHHPAAAAALFGQLKDQVHGAFEVAGGGEVFGGAEQHRRVPIVAAGVHPAVVLRAMGEIVQLLDRQRVHIGAQTDRGRDVTATDRADHPVPASPRYTSHPNSASFEATRSEVRCSAKASSGWAWMSRRIVVSSSR